MRSNKAVATVWRGLAGTWLLTAWVLVPEVGAQWLPLDGRAFVDVNELYQAHSQEVSQRGTFSLYDEAGSFEATQGIDNGGLWDIGFGYQVWRDLSVGLGVAQFSKPGPARVSGSVPHPLFYDRPRSYAQDLSTGHKARAIYLQALYRLRIPDAERIELGVMAGPAHLRVWQDLVRNVTVSEVGPPFSTVNATPVVNRGAKSTLGVLVGADIGYRFHPNVGAGVLLRYVAGRVGLPGLAGERVEVDAAGFQVGGGVRLRF